MSNVSTCAYAPIRTRPYTYYVDTLDINPPRIPYASSYAYCVDTLQAHSDMLLACCALCVDTLQAYVRIVRSMRTDGALCQ